MGNRSRRFFDNFTPEDRKEQEDAVAAFLANGGKVTKLKGVGNGKTSDYAFRKMEQTGFDQYEGKTGGVALFSRTERESLPDEE